VEEHTIRDRHAAHYAHFLQARARLLRNSSQRTALTEIGADIENERAAWEWAIARSDADAIGRSWRAWPSSTGYAVAAGGARRFCPCGRDAGRPR